jgi:hypothetical protein
MIMRPTSRIGLLALAGVTLLAGLAGRTPAQAADFVDSAFLRTWQRTDAPVVTHVANRSWTWGPTPLCSTREPYVDAPDGSGQRLVQYFDKSRMELNNPAGDPNNPYYVTNGLLAYELISGQIQTGNSRFEPRQPADIPLASDSDDGNAPTYRSFGAVTSTPGAPHLAAPRVGQKMTATIDKAGNVGNDAGKAFYPGTVVTYYDNTTNHNVPQIFWDFINSTGPIQVGGKMTTGQLSDPTSFVVGLPISEAYWARVKVAGQPTDVLIQAFQRRVLTYLPALGAPWNVQMGNIGLHYLQWRYGSLTCNPVAPAATATPVPPTATPVPAGQPVALPLYRLLKTRTQEHFYTTDAKERADLLTAGYAAEGTEGRVWNMQVSGSTPLYRMYNNKKGDAGRHLYTVSNVEVNAAVRNGWVLESAIGYAYAAQAPQTVPLYRWYRANPLDWFYTLNPASAAKQGYVSNGIACYVLPNP